MAQAHSSAHQPHAQGSVPTQRLGPKGEILPPNQSMTTSMLYERARQAAVAKSSNTTRREGLHSTRRPWTPEEEKALMAGLDTVKGPHWSQILSLYGLNGSVCDILKDRTQVQLKDKARNLKLFFLKTNSEMPYYLQSVTGELKTRAPGQAARKEAEEKARMSMEEEQARIHGMMNIGGGMPSGSHSVANTPLAASPSKRVSPAAPGFGGGGVAATAPTAAHATPNGASPAAPMHPRVKVEPLDQHALPKATAFPPIQPAPGPAIQQARAPLPALQPQPALQHQQAKPQNQQFQQPPQVRPQEAQKQPLSQQQQHPQRPPKAPLQNIQQQRAQQPPAAHQPTQVPQAQAEPHGLPRPAQATSHSPAPRQSPPRAPQAPMGQTPPQQPLPLPTPPIPPNHHTGRDHAQAGAAQPPASQQHAGQDHAQDARLYETLQAAIAASTSPGEGHLPLAAAAAVAEGSGN